LAKPRIVRDVPDSAGDQTLWLAAQQEWRTQTAKPSYEAWLKGLVLLELTESEALIGVPSQLAHDWVADRFAEMIAETLERLLERPVALRFEICEWLAEATSPAVDESVPEDVQRVPNASALMEYTLSRRAVWTPGAQRNDGQLEYRYETEDIAGKFVIDYALGELTTAEMELVAWVLGHWDERAGSAITFSAREYVRDLGASWAGWRGKAIRDSIHRIHRTRFSGTVYDKTTKDRKEKLFGIFDTVDLHDKAESVDDGWGRAGTVTVRLSQFLVDQIKNKQFVRINWRVLRGSLKTPLARRLYVFLESQKGFGDTGNYSITIDKKFQATLGSRDTDPDHGSRYRKRLNGAAQEIVEHDPRYRAIQIRPSKSRRGMYVMEVQRDPSRVVSN
jgi:DnaA N-terminal domain/Replication initiator protein A